MRRGAAPRTRPSVLDVDRPGGDAAGGERQRGRGVGEQRRIRAQQPLAQQRQEVVVRHRTILADHPERPLGGVAVSSVKVDTARTAGEEDRMTARRLGNLVSDVALLIAFCGSWSTTSG